MRFLIDFTPILLFFGAYKLYDIYAATAVIMAATVVQCLLIYKLDGKLPMMQKITLLLIVVFGSMTLFFHDERFIKWKPTVLYGALAVGLSVALWVMRKNYLKLLLGSQLTLPDAVWMRLNKAWIVYCVFMSVLNGYVAAQFSTEDWVNFKIWGYVFPIAFIVGQGLYMARYLKDSPDAKEAGHE
jgi:intracellular septation protein